MYDIRGYGRMIADCVRMRAYAQALSKAVRPGSVVADIGTGVGIFALLACRFGARRVYAIESDDIIQVAREIAAANGCADRIEFIQGLSTQVCLRERCDVIVSDLRGVLPWLGTHILSIVDARDRFLAPEGALIPRQDVLWAAVVEAPELYAPLVGPWVENHFGYDLQAARPISTHTWQKARVRPDQLLTEPRCCGTLDYATVQNTDFAAQVTWKVTRDGTASGLILWFDTNLNDGAQLSNSPMLPELIYGSAFFPWSEEVRLCLSDTISVELAAHLVVEEYVWRWETRVFCGGNPSEVKAHFQQSSFLGIPLSPTTLRKREANYTPRLNEEGLIDQFILGELDGRTSLRDLAKQLTKKFPQRFPNWENALNRVAELSLRYS